MAMNDERTNKSAELLHLPDDEFFALTEQRRIALADAFSDISDDDSAPDPAAIRPRLVLGAPSSVDLKVRNRLPVLLGSFETGLRRWQVNLQPNLALYVKNCTTGQLLHSTPLISVRRGHQPLPSGGGNPPHGPQAAATATAMVLIDLLDRMAGQLTANGEISVTAVAYDARSNTVRVHLDGLGDPKTPVADRQSYVRAELDSRQSIEPEVVVPDRGSARSGFRIRVAEQFSADGGVLRTELNQPFLPAHVVLVRVDQPAIEIRATPPVQQVVLPDGKLAYNALFLVEIGGATGHPLASGDYQAYLDLGVNFLGPYPLKVED